MTAAESNINQPWILAVQRNATAAASWKLMRRSMNGARPMSGTTKANDRTAPDHSSFQDCDANPIVVSSAEMISPATSAIPIMRWFIAGTPYCTFLIQPPKSLTKWDVQCKWLSALVEIPQDPSWLPSNMSFRMNKEVIMLLGNIVI